MNISDIKMKWLHRIGLVLLVCLGIFAFTYGLIEWFTGRRLRFFPLTALISVTILFEIIRAYCTFLIGSKNDQPSSP